MKNVLKATFLVMMLSIAIPSVSGPLKSSVKIAAAPDAAEMQRLEQRLKEINAMDIQSMSKSEKKAMRKEVKAIKKKMDSSGGIYLSAGAVILIIVLLIILL